MPSKVCLAVLLLASVTRVWCQCPSYCPSYYRPVCASNGRTYANDCELSRASCRLPVLGLLLTKVHEGRCRGTPQISVSVGGVGSCSQYCQSQYQRPVCGSDGVTYRSECHLRQAACTSHRRIFVVHDGSCSQGHYQECQYYCHDRYRPVCGSDGRTYPNDCRLKQASCGRGYLYVKHRGPCFSHGYSLNEEVQ